MSGGAKVAAIYARELTKRGHQVRIISPAPNSVPMKRRIKQWLSGDGWISDRAKRTSHLQDGGLDWRVLERTGPISSEDVPDGDVVIATWWETAEWVASFPAQKGAKVYFIQGHEIFPHVPADRCRATYRLPFHKIVVAKWLRELMGKEYGDSQVDLVPNSVDKEQFFAHPRSKQPYPTVGLLYSASEVKGVDVAIAALERVRRSYPTLRVLSFGHAPLTRRLSLPGSAQHFTLPPQEFIRQIYSGCDVWLTASRSEGFNLTAMEAMACRTPVVSTRTGWPEEAIRSGWNGWLSDIDDVNGLAFGVNRIFDLSDEEWRAVSENAFSTVANSSWSVSADAFEEALERAIWRAAKGEIGGGTPNC